MLNNFITRYAHRKRLVMETRTFWKTKFLSIKNQFDYIIEYY